MTTQSAYASYQEVIDLHTESDTVSVIGIHTPTGSTPHKMFEGFFKQFKKFKYLGCSVSFVPAARLPADPLQVSYEAGETTIDPRDMLNPLMFHGCHGDDLGVILNKLYKLGTVGANSSSMASIFDESDSAAMFGEYQNSRFGSSDILEQLYYKALTDNTWKKAHPQKGFRKSGLRPLVYSLATNHQFLPQEDIATTLGPDNRDILGFNGSSGALSEGVGVPGETYLQFQSSTAKLMRDSNLKATQLFTPRLTGLGWLDTYSIYAKVDSRTFSADSSAATYESYIKAMVPAEDMTTLPTIFMGVILLPPAYKTEQYFRMIITHHFGFKQFRGVSFTPPSDPAAYFDWNNPDSNNGGLGSGNPDDPGEGGDDVEFPAKYTILGVSNSTVTISDGEKWVTLEVGTPVLPESDPHFATVTDFQLSLTNTPNLSLRVNGTSALSSGTSVYSTWSSGQEKWTNSNLTDFDAYGSPFDSEDELGAYLNEAIENGSTELTFYDPE